jgi:hypothetical protein
VVVGEAAQQGHGRVAVGVDQPGHQQVVVQGRLQGRAERPGEAIGRDHGHDAPVAQRDGMVFQHGVVRVDRQDPARADDLVDVLQYPSLVARVP